MLFARAIRDDAGAVTDCYAIDPGDHPRHRRIRKRADGPKAEAPPELADRPTSIDPTILDAVLGAIRFEAEADGLWCLATDETLVGAAGLDVATVAEAVVELERLKRLGVLDGRQGVTGRVLFLPDGPRGDELRWLLTPGASVPAPPIPFGERQPPGRIGAPRRTGRGNDLAIATMPKLIPWFPVGPLVPTTTCNHARVPIPAGSRFCCMVCLQSGLDDVVRGVARRQFQHEAALADSYRDFPAEAPAEPAGAKVRKKQFRARKRKPSRKAG